MFLWELDRFLAMNKRDTNLSHKNKRKAAIEDRRKRLHNRIDREFIKKSGSYNCIAATSKRMYGYYKDANINPKYTYVEWKKIVDSIFKEVQEGLVHNDSGVFLKDIGYFGVVVYPEIDSTLFRVSEMKETLHIHKPHFFPIRKDSKLQPWTMVGSFFKGVVTKIYAEADKGKKYKLEFTSLSGMYATKSSNQWKKD